MSLHSAMSALIASSVVLSAAVGIAVPAARAAEPLQAPAAGATRATACPAAQPPLGAGTAAQPYQLVTAANLVWVHDTPSSWSATVEQLADLDLTGCTWASGIGTEATPFTGTYLGNGRAIANLSVDAGGAPAGMFGTITDGTLQSISVAGASITGTGVAGGLVGRMRGASAVRASSTSGRVQGGAQVGGIVGSAAGGIVVNDYSTATVTASRGPAGGIVGSLTGQAIVRSSYANGSVSASATAGPVIGAGSTTAVRDTFWIQAPTSGTRQAGGLQRTAQQMRDLDTFASAGWNIADGWSPAQPWAMCTGVKGGMPFHSKDFDVDPCAGLAASTSVVLAQAGVAIAPVSMTASNFTPTSFAVTRGSLPTGISMDAKTGVISGTPTAKAPRRTVVVTGTGGGRDARIALTVGVVRGKPSATNPYSGCDTLQSGSTLTVTCTTVGTHAITAPAGATLVGVEALGADGARTSGRGGSGALVTASAAALSGHQGAGSYVVTVGSAGVLKSKGYGSNGTGLLSWLFDTGYGGGYSSVQASDQSLVLAAGGGGGGDPGFMDARFLGPCYVLAIAKYPLPAGTTAYTPELANQIGWETIGCIRFWGQWAAEAGTAPTTVAPAADWASHASGASGSAGVLGFLIGGTGAAGTTYVPDGSATTPRPATDGREARAGKVVLTFDSAGGDDADVNTAGCSTVRPALGEIVTCSTPGLARIVVPAEAEAASVSASGAGGGAGLRNTTAPELLTGGPGAKVTATIDVSALDTLTAVVGRGGATEALADRSSIQADVVVLGSGGGYSSVGAGESQTLILAGGGGGANGFTAQEAQQLPSALAARVAGDVPGQTATQADAIPWALPADCVDAWQGSQGQSWQATTLVAAAAFDCAAGAAGGSVDTDASGALTNAVGGDGLVSVQFCALPGAPTLTSVAAGTSPGSATVDVLATAPTDTGGCAPTAYQFRTSAAMPWASAPALNFPIVYDLAGGQSVCVQMRARNAAGWGEPSAYTCGTASDLAATSPLAGATITVATGGATTPTAISVSPGDTFVVRNFGTTAGEAYLRPTGAFPATVTMGGTTCVGDGGSTPANCHLNPSTDSGATPGVTTFTVVSTGEVLIYTGSNNGSRATTITIS